MEYLVAVKFKEENEIFRFDTREKRQEFIDGIEEGTEGLEYSTSEVETK